MCGITGFIGNIEAYSYILKGLLILQNRGYDSAGICTIKNKLEYVITKFASTGELTALDMVQEFKDDHNNNTIGMGHTRWATHGAKTDINSHPHTDNSGKIVLIHNGIIENYYELKKYVESKGITLHSQTDTEVIANLIYLHYIQCHHMEEALIQATQQLEGTWGLVVMCLDKPDNMYCARHGSPLLIGFGGEFLMIASEQSGFAGYVNNYICLNNGDVVVLRKRLNTVTFEKKDMYDVKNITTTDVETSPYPYLHWTIKEIDEQYKSSIRAISLGARLLSDDEVKLGGLNENVDELLKIDHLIILGCGTSYHAGAYSVHLFKDLCNFTTVQCFDGAEFNNYDIPLKGNTCLLFMSQSGETKDLFRCINIGNNNNLFMIGVVNVVDSLIAREMNCGVYLNAGREVGVASTKSFTSQIIVLMLIAIFFAQIKNVNNLKRKSYIKSLHQIPQDIKHLLNTCDSKCNNIASILVKEEHLFILGKNNYKPIAQEGSLKLKEIGYIHSEAYGMQSLRHGPYSLLEKGTPILFILPDDENFLNVCNIIEEVHSRHATIIVITNSTKEISHCTHRINVPTNSQLQCILLNIPIQLISYYMALEKGHNPDKPRNLAKVVTV